MTQELEAWDLGSLNRSVNVVFQTNTRWYRLVFALLKHVKATFRSKRVLEVCCGPAGFLEVAKRKGAYTVGVDITPKLLRQVKRCGVGQDYVVADAEHLPFKEGAFDIVVCSEGLEHIPNYLAAFNQLGKVTCKNGYLVITVPKRFNVVTFYAPLWIMANEQPLDLHHFSFETLRQMAKNEKLHITKMLGIGLLSFPAKAKIFRKIEQATDKPAKPNPIHIHAGMIATKANPSRPTF